MRKLTITIVLMMLLALAAFLFTKSQTGKMLRTRFLPAKTGNYSFSPAILRKLSTKAKEAKKFTLENGFNHDYVFMVDMSLASGRNRFFVYDMNRDTLLASGLVTHGRCNQNWLEGRQYDNKPGCGCTSLGKYRIGYSYKGRFGKAFKLYGLEKTNDKAFERFVVLHSHSCVPEQEVMNEICQSDGCPTVSPGFLLQITPYIQNSKKPVMLWIFD